MNIFLIPYTLSRHFVVALYVGGAGLIAWWLVVSLIVVGGPVAWDMGLWWSQSSETFLVLGAVGGAVSFSSVLAEGSLRRRKLAWRVGYASLAAGITMLGILAMVSIYGLIKPRLGGSTMSTVLGDASLVTLRYRVVPWAAAGLFSGLGPWVTRRFSSLITRRLGWGGTDEAAPATWGLWGLDAFQHLAGGLVAGLLGAAVWHLLGFYPQIQGDLYLASALGCLVWGMVHGLFVWGIPDELYAGWLRVLSTERYGTRIPIPSLDGSGKERFVGHFPRGLDLFLPGEQGVAELHLSVLVDEEHQYAVRGLSQQPTSVRRFMERIDLSYDPRQPLPLETELSMEDRIVLGADQTVVEFLMLPKEER